MGAGFSEQGLGDSKISLIVIHGPTASGKSDLAIDLAKKFNGEIVSADSRQVYEGLDVGTGKVTKAERRTVRHHLLDIAQPGSRFTVARFKKLADHAIDDIRKRGKVPFLVGGSALYTKAVVDGYAIPTVRPNWKLRKTLERQPLEKILKQLKKCDGAAYERIDRNNPRRVIRALEIALSSGAPAGAPVKMPSRYQALHLALDIPRERLYGRIDARVDSRVRRGMIREVERLIEQGVSKKWLKSLGLEYRCVTDFLIVSKKFHVSRFTSQEARQEMLVRLKYAIHDFARRQLTWYRAMPDIVWITSRASAQRAVREFLKKQNSLHRGDVL